MKWVEHSVLTLLFTYGVIGVTQGAAPSLHIDLLSFLPATNSLERIYGASGNGNKGVPVCGGFDCNGDGIKDVAFAGIQSSPLGRLGAGEVNLIFRTNPIGGTLSATNFSPTVLQIAGTHLDEVCGAEIWMDDVTGDGLGDLIIGRQNLTALGRTGAGGLTILVGDPALALYAQSLQYLDLLNMPTNMAAITFIGAAACDRLGVWMRTGDVDGDTIADILVGADQADALGEVNRGECYLIRGGTHLVQTNIVIDLLDFGTSSMANHIARIQPPEGSAGHHFGGTCQMADLDNNGKAEVLASAALNRAGAALGIAGCAAESSGGSLDGTLYIVWDDNFSGSLWTNGHTVNIGSAPGSTSTIHGASFNRSFGEEIIGGLDYDGDEKVELFVGDLVAAGNKGVASGVGHVFFSAPDLKNRTFTMNTPPPDIRFSVIHGPTNGAIGADTVTQGDFDGDGLGDLVIGNPHDRPDNRQVAGTVYVLYGKQGGWPAEIQLGGNQLPDPDTLRVVEVWGGRGSISGDTGDTLCYSAASGDLDDDGRTDIIMNEMVGNGVGPSSIDMGNLIILSGAALLDPPLECRDLEVDMVHTIAFQTSKNDQYHLQHSIDVLSSNWITVATNIIGTGGVLSFTNAAPGVESIQFYRWIQPE